MASCIYATYVGGLCGNSQYNPANSTCVFIGACNKDIKSHLKSFHCYDSTLKVEKDLLLARAGIFDELESNKISICPRHRELFGIRWRSTTRTYCTSPSNWAPHGQKKVKGDRGITSAQSQSLYNLTGILVPVASPICKKCRIELTKTTPSESGIHTTVEDVGDAPDPVTVTLPTADLHSLQLTPPKSSTGVEIKISDDSDDLCEGLKNLNIASEQSIYQPESSGESSNGSNGSNESTLVLRRLKLNNFLSSSGKDPVKVSKKTWAYSSVRTKKDRISKAKDAVVSSLEVIAPDDPGSLWLGLKKSQSVEIALGIASKQEDEKYLRSLAETYENAASWDTRRQILSIMADIVPSSVIQQYIPGITEYRIKVARQHKSNYGRGVPVEVTKSPRMRVDDIQLDHFLSFITSPHVIQDLPFGQRYLHLSNGKVLETPNVIRSMIPQRIVDQYRQFCEESNFTPFSESTMLRILSSCSASVRKSLHGLDYFTAEGAKAIDDLVSIAEKLGDRDRQWVQKCGQSLKEGKQYLKADYKIHVTDNSNVPDHCRVYALSDGNEKLHSVDCDHPHDKSCSSCDDLTVTIQEIKTYLDSSQLTDEERDNLTYLYRQAVQAVDAWKAHQLRTTQQDKARTDLLDDLDESTIMITLDWAMKFLPEKYRETQADWFAKRGISWHISVVVRKINGKLQHQVFVHICKNCSQETDDVLLIVEHLLLTLKESHPEIENAFLRADNAGCYHSVAMLSASHFMESTGINIQRVDFSDPQGGKGPCDRKAATIKAHVRRYINEGNDVVTASQFKEAILSYGGVNGVRIALVDLAGNHSTVTEGKIEGVSFLNNFSYEKRGLVTWKAYSIGKGKVIPWPNLKGRY